MTRFRANQISAGRSDLPRRVAVVERRQDRILLLIAARSNGQTMEMVTAHEFGSGDDAGLSKHLAESQVDRVIHILPGAGAICRTFELPVLAPEHVPDALALQAEAELPASLDPHRRTAVLMPWNSEGAERLQALAIGWPGEPDRMQEEDDERHRYVPQVVCLMELMALDQQEGFGAVIDRDRGAIELIMHRADRAAVRTARLPGQSQDQIAVVERLVRETAYTTGLDPDDGDDRSAPGSSPASRVIDTWCESLKSATGSQRRSLTLDDRYLRLASQRVVNTPSTDHGDWWSQYGLLVGAVIGLTGPRRAALDLEPEPPDIPVNLIDRSVLWLGEKNHAVMAGLVAFLLILVLPITAGYGRYGLLLMKTTNLNDVQASTQGFEEQLLLYDLLSAYRLPMTKLIADICGAANVNTQFETLTIKSSDRRLTITGLVPSVDLSGELHDYLTSTQLFEGGRMSDEGTRESGRSFNFSAIVASPFIKVEPKYNYRDTPVWTMFWGDPPQQKPRTSFLRDRPWDVEQIGDGALAYAMGGGTTIDESSGSSSGSSAVRRPSGSGSSGTAGSGFSSGRSAAQPIHKADPSNPPPPLTKEQIDRMNKDETYNAMIIRAQLKTRKDVISPDVLARIVREWDMLNEHRKTLTK